MSEPQKTINFFLNHNNKLDCDAFTTIRPEWDYYKKGEFYGIVLKKKFLYEAQILNIKKFYLKDLSDYMSYIDVGKSPQYLKVALTNMYPKKDLQKEMLLFILLAKKIN